MSESSTGYSGSDSADQADAPNPGETDWRVEEIRGVFAQNPDDPTVRCRLMADDQNVGLLFLRSKKDLRWLRQKIQK